MPIIHAQTLNAVVAADPGKQRWVVAAGMLPLLHRLLSAPQPPGGAAAAAAASAAAAVAQGAAGAQAAELPGAQHAAQEQREQRELQQQRTAPRAHPFLPPHPHRPPGAALGAPVVPLPVPAAAAATAAPQPVLQAQQLVPVAAQAQPAHVVGGTPEEDGPHLVLKRQVRVRACVCTSERLCM